MTIMPTPIKAVMAAIPANSMARPRHRLSSAPRACLRRSCCGHCACVTAREEALSSASMSSTGTRDSLRRPARVPSRHTTSARMTNSPCRTSTKWPDPGLAAEALIIRPRGDRLRMLASLQAPPTRTRARSITRRRRSRGFWRRLDGAQGMRRVLPRAPVRALNLRSEVENAAGRKLGSA